MALKGAYFDKSLITAQMDALSYDAAHGFRKMVIGGFTATSTAAGQQHLTLAAGNAVIEGYEVFNDLAYTTPNFPVSSVQSTFILALVINLRPSYLGAQKVYTQWLTQAQFNQYSEWSLFASDPETRTSILPLYQGVGTSGTISSLARWGSSYNFLADGNGNAYGGQVMRVFPHDISIGAGTTGHTYINSDFTTPSRVNGYFANMASPNNTRINQDGVYRMHLSASIDFGSTATVPTVGYPFQASFFVGAGVSRPSGMASTYPAWKGNLYSTLTQVSGTQYITCYKGDTLNVLFNKSETGLPANTWARLARYEIEYLGAIPAQYQGTVSY